MPTNTANRKSVKARKTPVKKKSTAAVPKAAAKKVKKAAAARPTNKPQYEPGSFMARLLERKKAEAQLKAERNNHSAVFKERIHSTGMNNYARFNGPRRKAA